MRINDILYIMAVLITIVEVILTFFFQKRIRFLLISFLVVSLILVILNIIVFPNGNIDDWIHGVEKKHLDSLEELSIKRIDGVPYLYDDLYQQ